MSRRGLAGRAQRVVAGKDRADGGRELLEAAALRGKQVLVVLRGAADGLAGVVYEYIEPVEAGAEPRAEGLDGGQVAEVDAIDVQPPAPLLEIWPRRAAAISRCPGGVDGRGGRSPDSRAKRWAQSQANRLVAMTVHPHRSSFRAARKPIFTRAPVTSAMRPERSTVSFRLV